MGGTIRVNSKRYSHPALSGSGTKFWFFLPESLKNQGEKDSLPEHLCFIEESKYEWDHCLKNIDEEEEQRFESCMSVDDLPEAFAN